MAEHTPQPWRVSDDGHRIIGATGSNCPLGVASMLLTDSTSLKSERAANARLIAAAPTMLNVLELIASGVMTEDKAQELARDAIAKATR